MADKIITFRYRSGYECTHTPDAESEDKWWEFIAEIMGAMNKPEPGVLISNSPFGIHKLIDVEAVHFGDAAPPKESSVPTLGFIKE